MAAKRSAGTVTERQGVAGWSGTEGQKVWWLIDETGTDSVDGMLALVEVPPGHEEPLHRHGGCEHATYVLRGSGVHVSPGGTTPLGEDEAVYVAPGAWHGFENDTAESTTLLVLYGGVGTPEEAGYELYPSEGLEDDGAETEKASLQELASDASLDEEKGFHDLGVFWLFNSENVGAESLVLAVSRWAPGGSHVLHWHPRGHEWFFVAAGGGAHLVEGGEIELETGEVVYAPAEELHGFRSKLGENTTAVYGYFGVGSLEQAGYEVPQEAVDVQEGMVETRDLP